MKKAILLTLLFIVSTTTRAQTSVFYNVDSIANHDFFRPDFERQLFATTNANNQWIIIPHFEFRSGVLDGSKPFLYSQAGLSMKKLLSPKLSIYVKPEANLYKLPDWLKEYEYLSTLPMGHQSMTNSDILAAFDGDLKAVWAPTSNLELVMGNGRSFLGNGYRSLLLSDQNARYPYIQTNVRLGNLRYRIQYNLLRNNHIEEKYYKFQALHALEWEINHKLSLSFFETIIWQERDTSKIRGFEWAYLNPVIFFRPLEFSIGSPDNMLMGLNIAWKIKPNLSIYSQVLLDEFFTNEIKNGFLHILHPEDSSINTGAWVNKQALQIGIKSTHFLGIKRLNVLAEFNYVRPYTYSHLYVAQNYSHSYQALAHPYGANFREFIFKAEYTKKQWRFDQMLVWKQWGTDSTDTHYGQNIFASTFDSPMGFNIPVSYYGNTTGQGIKETTLKWHTTISYQIKANKIVLFGGILAHKKLTPVGKAEFGAQLGVKWNMSGASDHWLYLR